MGITSRNETQEIVFNWRVKALDVILRYGFLFSFVILFHAGFYAYVDGNELVKLICAGFVFIMLLCLVSYKINTKLAKKILIFIVISGAILPIIGLEEFELSKYGIFFLFSLPLYSVLFFSNKTTIILILLNILPFFLLLKNDNSLIPIYFDFSIAESHTYLASFLFVIWNVCLPLAFMQLVNSLSKNTESLKKQSALLKK
ncbi:hypothetical protein N7931_17370 [Catenovulum sp. 2E275]|uniref:hypothetical protein n=1 Tax=Catenovulum sp. 2E275 TaxID=2980497 RepID=UPI0021D25FBB|nr:hypothetical protein [Catenovulum sp. 2E275]MCU4677396.1 hypothetical protein [Catenovulum sp. 2E275]